MPLTDQEKEYWLQQLNQDRFEAPLTDAQLGEQAGIQSVNNVVPEVNQLMKSGERGRYFHSPEAEQRILQDQQAYDEEKRYLQNQQLYDKSDFSEAPRSDIQPLPLAKPGDNKIEPLPLAPPGGPNYQPLRNPSSQNAVEDALYGKEVPQIPTLPSLQQPSNLVQPLDLPKLTDVAVKETRQVPLQAAGSTAPKNVTEQEVATSARDTSQRIKNDLAGSPGYYDTQKQGIEAKFNADEASAVLRSQMLQQRQAELQTMMDDNARREQEAISKAEEAGKSLAQVDPNRVWNNTSMWAKLSLIAGAALQGRAGSDAGLQMMQSMVANDLKSQEADQAAGVKKQGSLIEALKPYAQNREQLMKMTNDISMEIAKNYGEAIKANVGKSAAPAMAIAKTAKEYQIPMLGQKLQNDEALLKVSAQEQNRLSDDAGNQMKLQDQTLAQARLKFDKGNMSEADARRLEGATAMGIAASRMEDLENDKNFNPTAISNAISSYMQGKGIPGTLSPDQAEYVANYTNYYSYLRQALTGAAASEKEDERIKLLVAPDKTFRKDAIKMYQAKRGQAINGAINSLNSGALLRAKNIPELNRFSVNRAKVKQPR